MGNKYDGWVVIGGKLDMKELEQELRTMKRELARNDKEMNKLLEKKAKIEYEFANYDELKQELADTQRRMKELNDAWQKGVSGSEYQTMLTQYDRLETKGVQLTKEIESQEKVIKKQQDDYADIELRLDEINKKNQNIKQNMASINSELKESKTVNQISKSVDDVGKSLRSVIKNTIRWGLAIFSIRSAYFFLRQAMSTLSEYNEQLAVDIEYIRYALASMLEPLIERIIDLVYSLLMYIGYIAKAWFNVNIFANASTKAFNRNNKALATSVKNAKELKNQLADFDEMDVLKDNDDTGGSGGSLADLKIPTQDLSKLQMNVPKWLEWIGKHGDLMKKILEGIAVAILAIKNNWSLLGAIGIYAILDGVIKLVKDLKRYLEDRTWSNFAKVGDDIGQIVSGIGLTLVKINPMLGLIVLGVGQLISSLSALPAWFEALIKYIEHPSWGNFVEVQRKSFEASGLFGKVLIFAGEQLGYFEKQTLSVKDAQEALKKATEDITSAQELYTEAVDTAEEALRMLEEAQNRTGLSGEELNKMVEEGTLDYRNMTTEQKEVYKAYLNNTRAQDNLKYATDNLSKAKENEKKKSVELKLATYEEEKQYDKYKKAVVDAFNKGEISADEAREYISHAMKQMSTDSAQTFTKDLPNNIKSGLEPSKFQSAFERFRNTWNQFIGGLKTGIEIAFNGSAKTRGGTRAQGGIYYPQLLPKLAVGGIINQPGAGVPYHGATIGERGAEAVIPLTDSQQMELLGATIGRYITVNANVTTTMNGRVISRELQRINNESDFAFNR